MSVTAETLRQARKVTVAIDGVTELVNRRTASSWLKAWDEVTDYWSAAVDQLVDMADGTWPTPWAVDRASRARIAMTHTAERLYGLAEVPGFSVSEELPKLLRQMDSLESGMALSQVPKNWGGIEWAKLDTKALDSIVTRSIGQVEASSWTLPARQQAVMKSTLIRGVAVGESPLAAAREMLKRLGGSFLGGLSRALTLARTEILDAYRAAAKQSRQKNYDILDGWQWVASLSNNTCPACLSMHGQIFDAKESGPDGHPNCACVGVPVVKSWKDLGIDIDDLEPRIEPGDGERWLLDQPEEVQRQILGNKGWDKWQSGEWPADKWVVEKDNEEWRRSFVVAPIPD